MTLGIVRTPQITILLCTLNGQRFLQDQLASLQEQTVQSWVLHVSDDGSTDQTKEILRRFANDVGQERVYLWNGPQKGFAENFLSLLARPEVKGDFFAFADQDDIWLDNKLEEALSWLSSQEFYQPALYCSRTSLIDEGGSCFGQSPIFSRTPSFANALVQSIAGGNTMVINKAARILLNSFGISGVVSHDWWAYILVSGCGGVIKYDPQALVLYRQHESNLIGMNASVCSRISRIKQLFEGRFRRWNDGHIRLLEGRKDLLRPDNAAILQQFAIWRNQGLFKRLIGFSSSPLYRQTILGNLGLWLGVLFKKV